MGNVRLLEMCEDCQDWVDEIPWDFKWNIPVAHERIWVCRKCGGRCRVTRKEEGLVSMDPVK